MESRITKILVLAAVLIVFFISLYVFFPETMERIRLLGTFL